MIVRTTALASGIYCIFIVRIVVVARLLAFWLLSIDSVPSPTLSLLVICVSIRCNVH
jgi:hypothetical protein